jgi:hypothetical protein
MAMAEKVIELFLNRNKEVIMQKHFLRRIIRVVQRAPMGPAKSEHLTSPEPELRCFSWRVRLMQDIPDSVE